MANAGKATKKGPQRALCERVGQRIAELRSARDWSQEELAQALGRTLRHIAALELGEYNVTLGTLLKVANALEVDVAELFSPPTGKKRAPGRPKKS